MTDHKSFTESPVVFLSLGPGDSELLTVKAVKALKTADVVLVPATKGSGQTIRSRAAAIIAAWCDSSRIETFEVPMQHHRDAVFEVYDTVCQKIRNYWQTGKKVVVAVEGDLSIYASVHYVLERLQQQNIPVIQQPGISSFIAAAASAGLSLVSQQQQLLILPGNAQADKLEELLKSQHVVVVMKLSQCEQAIKDFLKSHPTVSCHYFEQVGTPDEYHTSEVSEISSRIFPYFSLCILSLSSTPF